MATLKGQNFRVLLHNQDGPDSYECVAMATNCTINLVNNTEDESTKDDVGMAAKPNVTSQSWNVQVDSMDVTNMAWLLSAIKNGEKFTLAWDETATTDNQTVQNATFTRGGEAYLNDATLVFNDRATSTKSIQFTGAGPLRKNSSKVTSQVYQPGTYTKGQFVRLFLSSDNSATPAKVIAAAKELQFHVSLQLENSTTKDTEGSWEAQEPTALNYDITTTALVRSGDSVTSSVQGQGLADLEDIYEAALPVKWQIANVSGANQRTKGSVIASGSVVVTALTINAPNRQTATYNATLTGWGAYTVGA